MTAMQRAMKSMNTKYGSIIESDTGVTAEFVRVTPELAQKWMHEYNTMNRKLRRAKVALLAEAMAYGRFMENGDTICFDTDGVLLDGQHRLQGCIDSGITVVMLVIRNLDPEARWTKDTGTKRSFSDVLGIKNYHYSSLLASTISQCIRYEAGGYISANNKSKGNVEYDVMLEWLERNPLIVDAVLWAGSCGASSRKGLTTTHYAMLVFEAKGLEEKAKEFITSLASMEGWYEGHPARTLYRWVEAHNTRDKKLHSVVYGTGLVLMFNKFARGEQARKITIPKGKLKDGSKSIRYSAPFPRVLTAADIA